MLPKEKKNGGPLIFAAALIAIAGLLFSLHYAAEANRPDGRGTVMTALDATLNAPLDIAGGLAYPLDALKALLGFAAAGGLAALLILSDRSAKEHADKRTAKGSSGWNTDYKGYAEKYRIDLPKGAKGPGDPNIILTKRLKFGLVEGSNVNVVIMGSAGSGKSWGFIKPNILQMSSSFVVTDPSGEIFRAMGRVLLENGYRVMVFSTSDMEHSHVYNPFDYVYGEDGKVDETRVTSMITMFQKNATEMKSKGGDPFWEKSAKALLSACAMYLLEFAAENERDMYHMLKLVQAGKVNEDAGSSSKTALDKLFDRARKQNPDAHCFSSYDTFKLAPAKTANSILISAAVDLNPFNQTKVRNMTTTSYKVKERNARGEIVTYDLKDGRLIRMDDNIDLQSIGDERTALFVNIPQADGTFNFLVSMMYSQMFDILYGRAEKLCPSRYMVNDAAGLPIVSMFETEEDAKAAIELYRHAEVKEMGEGPDHGIFIYNPDAGEEHSMPGYPVGCMRKAYTEEIGRAFIESFEGCTVARGKGRLPWHVQCLLDEFANIGEIPEFPQKLATMRKYEISCVIVLQSLSQLKTKYDKLYNDILSNCAITVFLGSQDPDTCEYVSKNLGKITQRTRSESQNGGKGGGSKSYSLDSRELLMPDEVGRIPKDHCIIMTANELPFFEPKFRCNEHPNFKWSGDNRKAKGRVMEIKDYVTCSEKARGTVEQRAARIAASKRALKGEDRRGRKPGMEKELRAPKDVMEFFGMAGDSPAVPELARKMKAPEDVGQEDARTTKVLPSGKAAPKELEDWTDLAGFPTDAAALGFPVGQNPA